MEWKNLDSGCPDKTIYPSIGRDNGKALLKRKMRIYSQSEFTVVTPSKWLYGFAKQSPVFKNKNIKQIYNGFDPKVFHPKDKNACRIALDIPKDAKVLMFSASSININNPWKGGRDLIDILKKISKEFGKTIHLLILGGGSLDALAQIDNVMVHHLGHINNDRILATCYSAADILLYPTKADNLPNILIEAITCGTPCITEDVGGCGEIIKDGYNGYVVKPRDTNGFASRTIELIEEKDKLFAFGKNATLYAKHKFNYVHMCENYYRLFSSLT
jgi:glycosyltransferase involved in cell wall biosynthesis